MSNLPPVVVASPRSVAPSAVCAAARPTCHAVPLVPVVSAAANTEQKALEEKVRALEIRLAQIEAWMMDTNSAPGSGRGHGRNPMHVVSRISITKLLYYSL